MRYLTFSGIVLVSFAAAACGDNRTEPVTRIDVVDARGGQSRSTLPRPEMMALMGDPEGPGRIIYEPPVNLAKSPGDSLVSAPFGITTAPDSAGRNPARPAPGRREGTAQDSSRGDTSRRARQDSARRPR